MKDLPSRLNQRVTFQTPPATGDGEGGFEGDWTDYVSVPEVWAEVLPTGGREAVIAGAQSGVQAWRVTVRYRSDVATGHRVVWGPLNLNIRSAADPDGMRESLVLFCDSGAMV